MWLKKVKKTASWTYGLSDLNGEEHLMKKNGKKQIKKNLELKKLSREKVVNYMLNGKATIVLLTAQLEKRHGINQGFTQAVLLMSVFELRLRFWML